jgi:hypothetical protein
MAAVQQHKEQFSFWQALNDLEFVTWSFTWLFRLMSRLAEPMMTLAAIYIIIEAGVPSVSVFWLHWLSVALLISAPEIILPGGFILAGELHEVKNPRWWLLLLMCWLFVVLTAVTLADLFVLHWTGTLFQVLMWLRCAAAFGYSILFRVITHRSFVVDMPTPSQPIPAPDVTAKIAALQVSLEGQIQGLSREIREVKPVTVVTEKPSLCEQVTWPDSALVWEPVNLVFMEYGQVQKEASNGTIESAVQEAESEQKPEPETEETAPELTPPNVSPKLAALLSIGRRTVSIKEVAEATGYTEKWIRNRVTKKVLKCASRNPDLVLIDSLAAWLQSERNGRSVSVPKREPKVPALQLVK